MNKHERGPEQGSEILLAQIETGKEYRAFTDLLKTNQDSQLYVVGGAVRDNILGKQPKDLDFVVAGMPAEELEKHLKQYGDIKLTGKQFAVYKFIPFYDTAAGEERIEIDVALPRTEQALTSDGADGEGGYRNFDVQSDPNLPIEDDLARRDFTFNAMALDIRTHKIVDPFGGQQDIKDKVVRAVGEPKKRLGEDYSRMLRAIRFATKYGFEIEDKTKAAITELAPKINATNKKGERIVARELIGREFIWTFGRNPKEALEAYERTELLEHILPEVSVLKNILQYKVFHPEGDVYKHTLIMLEKIGQNASMDLKLSVLFHDLGKATAVQVQDLETKERKDIKDPVAFFNSTEYDPKKQRVQNIGHERDSVDIAREIISRLRLTQFSKSKTFGFNVEDILHNVRYHLLQDIDKTRPTRAEKILFKNGQVRADLLALAKVDPMTDDLSRYNKAVATVKKLTGLQAERVAESKMPSALINGKDLINLGYKPGKSFGDMLGKIRDAQLSGQVTNKKEALEFIKENFSA